MSCGLPNALSTRSPSDASARTCASVRLAAGSSAERPRRRSRIRPRCGVDDEVVGVHGAGDHRVAEATRGVEHGLPPPASHRVGREQHACRLGVHHSLHDDGQRDPGAVDALGGAVGDRAVGPQRRPAAMHGVEHIVDAGDVEVGVLLAGEARAGQVLRGGRRSHRDRTPDARDSSARRRLVRRRPPAPGTVQRGRPRARPAHPCCFPPRRWFRRTASRYASVVTQKPGGTSKPARISSPRFAALPPTAPMWSADSCARSRTSAVSPSTKAGWSGVTISRPSDQIIPQVWSYWKDRTPGAHPQGPPSPSTQAPTSELPAPMAVL